MSYPCWKTISRLSHFCPLVSSDWSQSLVTLARFQGGKNEKINRFDGSYSGSRQRHRSGFQRGPVSATHGASLMFEEQACPVDGTPFTNFSSAAYSTYGRYMDWEPISYMSFPIPVGVCTNGFIVDLAAEDFSEELIETRMAAVNSPEYRALTDGHTGFWLYYNLLSLTGELPEDRWWIALQASWEADMCQTGEYESYVRATLRELDDRAAQITPDDELFRVVHFLRVNLRRRVGEFDDALQVMSVFRRDHEDQIDSEWSPAFSRLESAILDGVSAQLSIAPEDEN
jgi:hypothetical protein